MDVRWDDSAFKAKMSRQIKDGMQQVGSRVQRDAQASMSGGGSPHSPSAPGTPPNVDTGALRRSGQTNVISDGLRIRAYVGFGGGDVNYARYLETGTRKMAARPYLRPALERNRGLIMRWLR